MHPTLIADYIITRSRGQMTPMQVIKLAFISHGYALALADKPLLSEPVEAWKYGPVIPSMYHALKRYGRSLVDRTIYCQTPASGPDSQEREEFIRNTIGPLHTIVDRVMETHGHMSGSELSKLTHKKGTPWRSHWKTGQIGTIIPDAEIRDYYRRLVDAGKV